jgi:hypothetical protein
MRAHALAWGLAAALACDGNTIEGEAPGSAPDAAAGAPHDSGRETGSGGAAGAIRLDAARDAGSNGRGPGDCSPEQTLPIESEDGGQWCSIPLPEFADAARNFINTRIEKNDGGTRDLGRIRSADECLADGGYPWAWYYYATDGATRIGFCPDTCAAIASEGNGKVNVIKGCVNPVLPD